jgi:hypothetical protein
MSSRFWLAATCLPLCACGRLGFGLFGDDTGTVDDARMSDASSDAAPSTFGPPQPLPGPLNTTGDDEKYPSVTADGLQLFFGTPRFGGYTIWFSTRATTADSFGTPTRIVELDGAGIEYELEVSPDGLELYYAANMPVDEVRRSTRATTAATWNTPVAEPLFGTRRAASFTSDALRVLIHDLNATAIDEYTRPAIGSAWTLVRSHSELAGFRAPAISSDGLELFVINNADQTLYRTERAAVTDAFAVPTRFLFGSPLDAVLLDDPELSADGHTLYLSAKPGATTDLYVTTR